jgi:hypothetical protein
MEWRIEPIPEISSGKEVGGQDRAKGIEGPRELRFEFQIAEEQVGDECHPQLGQQGVLRSADKAFDLELLLDGFEEEFDLPAVFVKLSDGLGGPSEVVGQKDNDLAGYRVFGTDAAQAPGEFLFGVEPFEFDDLV